MEPLLSRADGARVADAFRSAGFTVDAVAARLGPAADAALGRGEPVPARRALAGQRDPLATLIRLLLLGDPVGHAEAAAALPLPAAKALLARAGDEVTAAYDVSPHAADDAQWWVVADRTDRRGRPLRPDHVLGVGAASTTLAQLVHRRPVATALDLGTGCGVQSLHLSRHVTRVTATDAVPRALALAAATFALSGVDEVELVTGDLYDAVPERRFDLVVSNPPFVVGPRARWSYRDAGLAGDDVSRRVVGEAADHLADGGTAWVLANWLHVRGEDWRDRVVAWIPPGCDAWVVQRDAQDPAQYVSLWLSDAGEQDDPDLADAWLAGLDALHVEAIGFGWVTLRRGSAPHGVVVEEILQPVDQPLGPHVGAWLHRQEWLRGRTDARLIGATLAASPALRLDVTSARGEAGWQPLARGLRLDTGLHPVAEVDEAVSALVAGCDGTQPLGRLVAVLAAATGAAYDDLAADVAPVVRALVRDGFLEPVE